MKKLSYLFALLFLASTIFIACGSDNDDPTPEPPVIDVPDREELEQTVYADEEEGESGVRFTTIAPWTSSVRDVRSATETKADDAETRSTGHWLSLTPSSGGAGSHTVALTLEPNMTGEDRTAVISINSAGTVLEISITQQAVRGDGTVPVGGVTLCTTTATLAVGNTATFTATVAPDNATNTNVLWSSNNHVVAIVNADGMVTAVSVGTAQITALSQDGNHTAIVEVTVVPVSVTGVTLNKNYTTLTIGNTETLIATVKPDDAANQSVTWSSSNPLVASVDEQGNVTALSVGETIITVTTNDGEYYDTCVVTVEPRLVTGVVLNRNSLQMFLDETPPQMLTATILPFNATNRNITWSSSNSDIATVVNGVVTAISAGTATITVTTEDGSHTATCEVEVIERPVTGVTLNRNTLQIYYSETKTETLIATVTPFNAFNRNVVWASSDPTVATVDNNGVVTILAVGNTTITVTTEDGGFTATCEVEVIERPVTGVTLDKTTIDLIIGDTETLTATIVPFNAFNQNVTWSSSNPAVATVSANGVVTAVGGGTTIITITTECGDFTATCNVAVSDIYAVEGVVIAGVRWATRNVDAPGTFAQNPESSGMFYQWNRRKGWNAIGGYVENWDSSGCDSMQWYAENNPCPAGWRMPTHSEMYSLHNTGSVRRTLNGIDGRLYGTAPNQIFLPAVGVINPWGEHVMTYAGFYLTSTRHRLGNVFILLFTGSSSEGERGEGTSSGLSVRCVAK